MTTLHEFRSDDFDRQGFAVVDSVLAEDEVALLREAIDLAMASGSEDSSVRDRGGVYAIRNVTEVVPQVGALHQHGAIARLVATVLGEQALLVRGLLFDKSPQSNWGIFWHQDLSIAVRERKDVSGFGPWSVKAGIPHVQPPPEILENMLTVRLHLDECPESNGALRVLPGSHRCARLSSAATDRMRESTEPFTCSVGIGGAVLMRPLLLHSSQRAQSNIRRRVVHLEFAAGPLPPPLEWNTAKRIAMNSEDRPLRTRV